MKQKAWTVLGVLLALSGSLHASNEAIEVETIPLGEVLQEIRRSAPAQVRSRHEAALAAEIAGTVQDVRVDTGQRVAAGTVLVLLDPTDARLALEQAKARTAGARARLTLAQVRADRGQRLSAQNFVSADELKALQTEVEVAKADLALAKVGERQARRTLAKTEVRAPYALTVRNRLAQAGQQVAPGTVLLDVVAAEAVELHGQIEAGQREGFGIDPVFVAAGAQHPVEVIQISPVVSPGTRTYSARFRFRAEPAAIGLEGRLEWIDRQRVLPAEFVLERDGVLGVFVLTPDDPGRARFHPLPKAEAGRPAVTDLAPETRVITRGRGRLRDGMPVRLPAAS